MTDPTEALARALTLEITRRDHGFQPGITGAYNDGIITGLKIALEHIQQAAGEGPSDPASGGEDSPPTSAAADLDVEALVALHRLFALLERLGRQADEPGPDHMVRVTVQLWRDSIQPDIARVQAALAAAKVARRNEQAAEAADREAADETGGADPVLSRDPSAAAALLRDTPEDRERLIEAVRRGYLGWIGPNRAERATDAILAELRKRPMICDYCAKGIPVVCGADCGLPCDAEMGHLFFPATDYLDDAKREAANHAVRPVHRIEDPHMMEVQIVPCVGKGGAG